MKKTIVLIILAVYIASIAVVNFFGLQVRIFDGVTYVSTITCESVRGKNGEIIRPTKYLDGDIPLFVFDFVPPDPDNPYTADPENLLKNNNVIQIDYGIWPRLATERNVRFEYDESAGYAVYHELSGSFIFLKGGVSLDVTIRATDGSNVCTKIIIQSRIPE